MWKVCCHFSSHVCNSETTTICKKRTCIAQFHLTSGSVSFCTSCRVFLFSLTEHWLPLLNVSKVYYILFSVNKISDSGLFSVVKNQTTLCTSHLKGGVSLTHWIHSRIFVRAGITIPSTCAFFHRTNVARIREVNGRRYFWSAFRIFQNSPKHFRIYSKFSHSLPRILSVLA